MLLGVIVAQGAIGFVQYFTDLPIVLVGFHMLGAALVSAAVTWVLLSVREPGGGEPVLVREVETNAHAPLHSGPHVQR